jgi:hypothetical protein
MGKDNIIRLILSSVNTFYISYHLKAIFTLFLNTRRVVFFEFADILCKKILHNTIYPIFKLFYLFLVELITEILVKTISNTHDIDEKVHTDELFKAKLFFLSRIIVSINGHQ